MRNQITQAGQFQQRKRFQGTLCKSLIALFPGELLGGEEYESTPHAADLNSLAMASFLLLSARMATLSFLATLAAKPVRPDKEETCTFTTAFNTTPPSLLP